MPSKEYDWVLGKSPPPIDLHSITKHRVYEEYLLHYIQVLNSNPLIPHFSLNIIDGFSGGGEYTHPATGSIYEGSPIRLIKSARAAEAAINLKRKENGINKEFELHVNYYFIEKQEQNFAYLTNCINRYGLRNGQRENIEQINSSFVDAVDKVVNEIKKKKKGHRCIFILDQYGYKEVPFQKIQYIFKNLPDAEIILTFATDWLINYMSSDPRYMKALQQTGLHEILDIDEMLDKKDTNEWRQFVQFQLHQAITKMSGAKHYTPFFIVSDESRRSFWLVHLSNHHRARDVMTQLHWELTNHFSHYGDSGFKMFGYDPRFDNDLTGTIDMFENTDFSFDEMAKEKTLNSIVVELPEIIHDYKDGITFEKFYTLVANTTPASCDHIRQGLEILIEAKEICIKSQDGKERRSANTIKDSDIVTRSKQNRLISNGRSDLVGLSKKKKGKKK